jgi:hypothetical protein
VVVQDEGRNIGSVAWQVHKDYLVAGNGYFLAAVFACAHPVAGWYSGRGDSSTARRVLCAWIVSLLFL